MEHEHFLIINVVLTCRDQSNEAGQSYVKKVVIPEDFFQRGYESKASRNWR